MLTKNPEGMKAHPGFLLSFCQWSAYIQPIFSQGHSCHLQDLDL